MIADDSLLEKKGDRTRVKEKLLRACCVKIYQMF